MEWSRPDTIPFPNIWKRFEGLREINGQKPKFWIQDVTEDLIEPMSQTMTTGFISEEPLCKYSKFIEDEVSVAEGREIYKYILPNKLTVACMTNDAEGKPKLAGVSCLARISKDDPHIELSGRCISNLYSLVQYTHSVKDPFTQFGVDEYLGDKGIYVFPEFRGQGICAEFLRTWVNICKVVGLKVVVGIFTSIVSQKAAYRVGFQELSSFDYAELEKVDPRYSLPGIQEHTKTYRLLYQFSGKCRSKLRSLVGYAFSFKDPFNYFGVDEYLGDKGIYVLPEFRGQGICYEFLNVWISICKAVGFKVVIGCFTSIVSQTVADRVGFKELNSVDYVELEKVNPNYNLPGIQEHTKALRLLYYVV